MAEQKSNPVIVVSKEGIEVEVIRKIGIPSDSGVDGVLMVGPGRKVKMTKTMAKKLQDAGAIKVSI